MFRTYLLPAWRSLSHTKAYSFITIFGLAIGICACIIIYIVAAYEFIADAAYFSIFHYNWLAGNPSPLPISSRPPRSATASCRKTTRRIAGISTQAP